MERFLGRFSPFAFVLLRIVSGLMMACHGADHLFGMFGGKSAPVSSFIGFGGAIEITTGFLIAFGLFTSIAAFLCSGTMAVAYFKMHSPRGFFPVVNHGDAAVLYCFLFLYVACHGAGILSLDQALFRRSATEPLTR